MTSATETNAPKEPHRRRVLTRRVLLLVPFVLITLWEGGHYARFGNFFAYGYHVDLVLDHSDIHAAHCLRLTNYTLHPLRFEAIQLPWGITDGEILYHNRLEKWNEQTHSWSTVWDSAEADQPPLNHPNIAKTLLPGQSFYPTRCHEEATMEGINKGDTVRLAAFTSYSKSETAPGQVAFYSPAFVVNEKTTGDQHKSESHAPTTRPEMAALQ